MQQLRFDREEIVWQEVPGEVSLAFLCSGCPLRCQGCHSSGSWKAGRGTVLSECHLRVSKMWGVAEADERLDDLTAGKSDLVASAVARDLDFEAHR